MSYTILIVDDEHLSRQFIHDLVIEQEPDASVHEAESAEEAIALLENDSFDIVFSDIKMPEQDGFGMLRSLSHRNFDLVFITAYNQYAIQAIKEGAIDYLLKPIKKTEFRETFEKIIKRRNREMALDKTGAAGVDYLSNKLSIAHKHGIKYIVLEDIVYLEASNTYTTLVLTNGEKIITSKPIRKFEEKLSARWFFKIHRSYLVNIYHFKEYISKNGDIALMDNGERLYISRYRLGQFLALIEDTSGKLKV